MQRNEKDLGAGRGESVFLIVISTSNREGCQPLKMKYDKDIYYKKNSSSHWKIRSITHSTLRFY